MSDLSGDFREADELLCQVLPAYEEQAEKRNERRSEIQDRKQKNLAPGARLVANNCSAVVISDDDGVEESDGDGTDRFKTGNSEEKMHKNLRILNHSERLEGEMERFCDLLKDGDEAQSGLEEEQRRLERLRFEAEKRTKEDERADRKIEREEERKVRSEDREYRDRLDFEKIKIIMQLLKDHTSK